MRSAMLYSLICYPTSTRIGGSHNCLLILGNTTCAVLRWTGHHVVDRGLAGEIDRPTFEEEQIIT